jgi:hypothetical protein
MSTQDSNTLYSTKLLLHCFEKALYSVGNVSVHLEDKMEINSNKQNSGISLLEIIVVGGGGCGGGLGAGGDGVGDGSCDGDSDCGGGGVKVLLLQ